MIYRDQFHYRELNIAKTRSIQLPDQSSNLSMLLFKKNVTFNLATSQN